MAWKKPQETKTKGKKKNHISQISHWKTWPKGVWSASVCQGKQNKPLRPRLRLPQAEHLIICFTEIFSWCVWLPCAEGAYRKADMDSAAGSRRRSCRAEPLWRVSVTKVNPWTQGLTCPRPTGPCLSAAYTTTAHRLMPLVPPHSGFPMPAIYPRQLPLHPAGWLISWQVYPPF